MDNTNELASAETRLKDIGSIILETCQSDNSDESVKAKCQQFLQYVSGYCQSQNQMEMHAFFGDLLTRKDKGIAISSFRFITIFSEIRFRNPKSNNQSTQDSRDGDNRLENEDASQHGMGAGSKGERDGRSDKRDDGRVDSSSRLGRTDNSSIEPTSLNGPGTSGTAVLEAELLRLISNCNTKLAEYEKLYIDFQVVASKDDIDKEGQASFKVAAAGLTKEGLKLSRFCVQNLANMSVAQLDRANNTVMHCKWQREFANDPCPELTFSSRTLTREFLF